MLDAFVLHIPFLKNLCSNLKTCNFATTKQPLKPTLMRTIDIKRTRKPRSQYTILLIIVAVILGCVAIKLYDLPTLYVAVFAFVGLIIGQIIDELRFKYYIRKQEEAEIESSRRHHHHHHHSSDGSRSRSSQEGENGESNGISSLRSSSERTGSRSGEHHHHHHHSSSSEDSSRTGEHHHHHHHHHHEDED